MNRLTGRNEKGDLLLCGEYVYGNNQDVYNGISLLEEYENTELEPEQIDELNKMLLNDQIRHGRALDKLLEYQKLEKQGLLIKLPCKVRDTVYVDAMTFGTRDDIEYAEAEVVSIRITKKQTFLKLRIFALGFDGMPYGCKNYSISSIGKTIFLTQEEAEKTLK